MLPVFCLVFGGGVFAFAAWPEGLQRVQGALRSWAASRRGAEFERQLSQDPKRVDLPSTDVTGRTIPREDAIEVLFVDARQDGMAKKLQDIAESREVLGSQLVIVARCDHSAEAQTLIETEKVFVVADQGGALHQAWNAFFPGRHYVVDGRGQILVASRGPMRVQSESGCSQ